MNSADRRREFRKTIRSLCAGRLIPVHIFSRFLYMLNNLEPRQKLKLLARVLEIGTERGGDTMAGVLGRLTLSELRAVESMVCQVYAPSRPDIEHLANRVVAFLLSNPEDAPAAYTIH